MKAALALASAVFLLTLLFILAEAAMFYDTTDPEEVSLSDMLLVLGPVVALVVTPGLVSFGFLLRSILIRRRGGHLSRRSQLLILAGFLISIGLAATGFMMR